MVINFDFAELPLLSTLAMMSMKLLFSADRNVEMENENDDCRGLLKD